VRKATRKLKTNLEKTTLGDISELAALKSEMEESQKSGKKKEGDKEE
jgi:small subunit ribosomal protein S1